MTRWSHAPLDDLIAAGIPAPRDSVESLCNVPNNPSGKSPTGSRVLPSTAGRDRTASAVAERDAHGKKSA